MAEDLLTLQDLMKHLQCSYGSARNLVLSGKLKASRLPMGWRVKKSDLDAYIKQCTSRQGRVGV